MSFSNNLAARGGLRGWFQAHGHNRPVARPEIKRAPAGRCEFLVRGEDGHQCECGDTAAWQNRKTKMLYCESHGQQVGRSAEVIALKVGADGRRETLQPLRFNRKS